MSAGIEKRIAALEATKQKRDEAPLVVFYGDPYGTMDEAVARARENRPFARRIVCLPDNGRNWQRGR